MAAEPAVVVEGLAATLPVAGVDKGVVAVSVAEMEMGVATIVRL